MATEKNKGKRILVVGATGRQGGGAARHLLERGFSVRALTRNPEKQEAKALRSLGAEAIRADMDNRASIDEALHGCYGVFSVQDWWSAGSEREVAQGKCVADAAKAAGVRHLVYSSVGSANRNTRLPHFESKWKIEQHIRSIGVPHTILRPVFFMENWSSYVRDAILAGTLPQPLDPDRTLQQICADDIGAFAALAFDRPDTWLGHAVDIAGDELTMPEVAEIFSEHLGHKVEYVQVDWDDFHAQIGDEMTQMYRWFNEVGYEADIDALRAKYPPLKRLRACIVDHGWQDVEALAGAGVGAGR